MISSVLINEKMTDRTLMNAVGRLLIKFLLPRYALLLLPFLKDFRNVGCLVVCNFCLHSVYRKFLVNAVYVL